MRVFHIKTVKTEETQRLRMPPPSPLVLCNLQSDCNATFTLCLPVIVCLCLIGTSRGQSLSIRDSV